MSNYVIFLKTSKFTNLPVWYVTHVDLFLFFEISSFLNLMKLNDLDMISDNSDPITVYGSSVPGQLSD